MWSFPSWPPGPTGSAAAPRTGDRRRRRLARAVPALRRAGRSPPTRSGRSTCRHGTLVAEPGPARVDPIAEGPIDAYAPTRSPGSLAWSPAAGCAGPTWCTARSPRSPRPRAGQPTPARTRPAPHRLPERGRRAAGDRAGRHRRAAGRRGDRRELGPRRARSPRRTSTGAAATGGRRTASRCWPPGSTTRARVARARSVGPTSPGRPWPGPRAGGVNAEVSLHLLDLDGGWVDVHWDRETYPYLVAVDWAEGGPLITVLRRMQQHGLVLAVDPRTGETQVHAELADPRWVEPVAGTPCHLPDGRVLVGGELAHDGYDARCLFADGTLLTPAVALPAPGGRADARPGRLPGPAGRGERRRAERAAPLPGTHGDRRRRRRVPPADHRARLAHRRGRRRRAGDRRPLARPHRHRWTVWKGDRAGRRSCDLLAADAAGGARGRRWNGSPTGGCRPPCSTRPAHVAGRRLPVLLDVDGGPGHQQVRADAARVARAAVVGRQRLRRGHRRQPGYARRGTVVREGGAPPAGRRDADRPGRRARRAQPASTPTWTSPGSPYAGGGSAAGSPRSPCSAARRCSAARSPGPDRRLGAVRHGVRRALSGPARRRPGHLRAPLAAGARRRAADHAQTGPPDPAGRRAPGGEHGGASTRCGSRPR